MNIESLIYDFFKLNPSAHNCQPFTFSVSDHHLIISVDKTRLLSAADPDNKILLMSLGSMLETLEMGLLSKGLKLTNIKIHTDLRDSSVAEAELVEVHPEKRAELPYLSQRFSYRGKFKNKTETPKRCELSEGLTLYFLSDSKDIKKLAQLYDESTLKVFSKKGYMKELYSWLRFSPFNKRWSLDGVNKESMSLNIIESIGASVVLNPIVFSFLQKLNVARFIIKEAPIMKSASAICLFTAPKNDPVTLGRFFMRGWLKLTELGLYGSSISLLTEDAVACAFLADKVALPENHEIISAFRVGPLPKKSKIQRARLPLSELNKKAQH